MDPNIMKFLEEDEDETMHSGADVEAFTAALNRDIEGDNTSTPQPPTNTDSSAALSQGTSHTPSPSQLFQQWQSSKREANSNFSNEEEVKPQNQEQKPSAIEVNRQISGTENQHPSNDTSRDITQIQPEMSRPQDDKHNVHMSQAMNMQNTDMKPAQNVTQNPNNESQLQRMQRTSNQQAMTSAQAANAMNNRSSGKQVPFALLLPVIEPQLDKDRALQLQGLYARLRNNNINKEEFVRHMRNLVGDHMLKLAVFKLQQQGQQPSAKQIPQKPSPFTDSMENNAQKENVGTIKHEREQQPFPLQKQQRMQFPQPSFPTYGNTVGNFHPNSGPNMNMSSQSLQMRQGPIHPTMGNQPMNLSDMKRMHHFPSNSQNPPHWQPSMPFSKPDHVDQMNDQQHKSQVPAQHEQGNTVSGPKDEPFEMPSRAGFSGSMNKPEPMSITAQLERQNAMQAAANNAKTPPKKPTVGQKKPLEAPVNPIGKKQKVSGALSDQSIEQLNDVTAVSGVNLKEEEEQLFSGAKEDSRVSEASRKVVQEEEERLILQKIPLQKKLAEIMAKCGVKNRSNDVERCLSLCVEERMRGLISNFIRISKQRVDIEKPKHRTVITSDVRQQIMSMNQKAREEWEKKQADAEKLQRADEPEGSGDGEDGRGKSSKVNKEEDDKMRTTAANVAARAAVGGDDMLSKWQLMAEQARQKREGGPDISQPSVDVGPKPVPNSERSSKDNNPDTEKTSLAGAAAVTATPGPARKLLRNQDLVNGSSSIARSITVKDVISVLGREVQMSRSILIYRLYEKMSSDSASES